MPHLNMSPYAAFVWPAWAISAVVLAGLIVRAVAASRRWTAALRAEDSPRAAQGAVGPEARPQAARSAIGPKQ